MSQNQWDLTVREFKNLLAAIKNASGFDIYVFCIDDEADFLEIVKEKLEEFGFLIKTYTEASQAENEIVQLQNNIALIISDYSMPTQNGFEFRNKVLGKNESIPFALLSGYVDNEMLKKAIELKVCACLRKPIEDEEIINLLNLDVFNRLNSIKDDEELLKSFLDDAEVLLEQAESLLVELEENHSRSDYINSIFGFVHTIKGASSFFHPKTLHQYAHLFEDLLKKIQSEEISLDDQSLPLLFKGLDRIKLFLAEFKDHKHHYYDIDVLKNEILYHKIKNVETSVTQNQPLVVESKEHDHHKKKSTEIKIEMAVLDNFLQASGQMTVLRNMVNKTVSSLEKKFTSDKDVLALHDLLDEVHKINTSMQTKIEDLRKISVKQIVKPLPRAVRDVAKKVSKNVNLEIEGEHVRVDTSIADVLNNCLLHLIKNSIDHGLENEVERIIAEKPKLGLIKLSFYTNHDLVTVIIKDDGRGIDTEKIIQKAIASKKFTEEQLRKMSDLQIQMLIFESGFSTASEVTDISGRGVGMSMVKSSVEEVDGKISILSQKNIGTQFTIEIPIPKSVLIRNCLFVEVEKQQFAIPQESIVSVMDYNLSEEKKIIKKMAGGEVINLQEDLIPIFELSKILNLETNYFLNQKLVVVKSDKSHLIALKVDHVFDFEDAVIKSIPVLYKNIKFYAGATFLNNGLIGLVLDSDEIIDHCCQLEEFKLSQKSTQKAELRDKQFEKESVKVLLFSLSDDRIFAVDQKSLYRIESIKTSLSEKILHNNEIMTMIHLNQILTKNDAIYVYQENENELLVLTFKYENYLYGVVVNQILDVFEATDFFEFDLESSYYKKSFNWNNRLVTLLDLENIFNDFKSGYLPTNINIKDEANIKEIHKLTA